MNEVSFMRFLHTNTNGNNVSVYCQWNDNDTRQQTQLIKTGHEQGRMVQSDFNLGTINPNAT